MPEREEWLQQNYLSQTGCTLAARQNTFKTQHFIHYLSTEMVSPSYPSNQGGSQHISFNHYIFASILEIQIVHKFFGFASILFSFTTDHFCIYVLHK